MDKLKTLADNLRSTEASEIAEAAVVLPLVFMFLLGIVWFGRAFNIYATIQQAAQQGALAAARPTCATCGVPNPFAVAVIGPAVDTAVAAVMQASSIPATQIVAGTASGPCTLSPAYKITFCQQVVLNSPSITSPLTACPSPPDPAPSQICGMVVTFQYPYQFYFPFTSLNLSTITLTAQAQTRTEN